MAWHRDPYLMNFLPVLDTGGKRDFPRLHSKQPTQDWNTGIPNTPLRRVLSTLLPPLRRLPRLSLGTRLEWKQGSGLGADSMRLYIETTT